MKEKYFIIDGNKTISTARDDAEVFKKIFKTEDVKEVNKEEFERICNREEKKRNKSRWN